MMQYEQFSQSQFKQKDKLKHTFRIKDQNANYDYIPIFQKDEKIKFRDQFYKIIKLQRRAETYLQYKILHLDSGSEFTMEYQFIFDDKQNDQNYEYYQDQTKSSSNESQEYRKFCRIALKKNNQDQHNFKKLTRFIHLNNLNQNAKIKLLHYLANDNQLEQLDYNQIYIDDKWQIKIQKNQQNQISCFVQAPQSISPIINYQQTFLIAFYYSILNNQVLFNQYEYKEYRLKQSLRYGFIDSNIQLQQQIQGSLSYQIKTQIPKKFLQLEIKRIYDQIAESESLYFQIQKNQQLRENEHLKEDQQLSDTLTNASNSSSRLNSGSFFDNSQFNNFTKAKFKKSNSDLFNIFLLCIKLINKTETSERISNHLQNSRFSFNYNKITFNQQKINSELCRTMSVDMTVAFLKLISCDCDSNSDTTLKLHVSSELKDCIFDYIFNEILDLIIKAQN